MSKRSKTTVSRQVRKVSSASYKAYYGITLIETLMSVGLLGVVLLPLLMTSTAYLSTKLLNNRTNSELSQNVNALGAKLHTLTASTTGVNHLTSTTNNLEMRIKTSTGARRIFHYSIIGAPGAQRLREFQGSTGNFTSTAAMRSLNEDSITLVGNTGFVYCNDTTCTVPTNTAAQNQAIARTAEMVVFDGNTATNVVRVGSGVVTGAEPVGLLFNAGDNSRKKTFLPSNTLTLGTDPILANGGGGTILPNPAIATNTDPEGLINVFTKAQVYGTPMGGRAVDADLRLATGSDSSFTALPLANVVPPIPPALPVAPSTTQTTRTDFSRIYREGPGTAATGNVRTILPNFQLDQTVADSFQGNMCFSGTQQVQGFQVYYWNRTMKQAALTSVQSADTVADPFTVTPECAGASSGYNNDANSGTYYAKSYPRRYWAKPQTKDEPNSVKTFHEAKNGWVEPIRLLWDTNHEAHYEWYAFDKPGLYDTNTQTIKPGYHFHNDPSQRAFFFTDGKSGGKKCGWFGWCQAAIIHYFYADLADYGTITRPKFATLTTPPVTEPTTINENSQVPDGYGTKFIQNQYQTSDKIGLSTLIHKNGNPDIPDVGVNLLDPLVKDPSGVDPQVGNYKIKPYSRQNRRFTIYGTEGSTNKIGDSIACDFTQNDAAIIASGFKVDRPYRYDNNRPNVWLVCSDLHRRKNIKYITDTANCKIKYDGSGVISEWQGLPAADVNYLSVQGTVSGTTFTITNYILDRKNGDGVGPVTNVDFYLDGIDPHSAWAGLDSSKTNSTTRVGDTLTIKSSGNQDPPLKTEWVSIYYTHDNHTPDDPDDDYDYPNPDYTNNCSTYDLPNNRKIRCNDDGSVYYYGYLDFYNNRNDQGLSSDKYRNYMVERQAQNIWIFNVGKQDAWFLRKSGPQAYVSDCDILKTPFFATVDVDGAYFNPTPIAGADTINADSFSRPYVIRDNSENYLFYNLIKTNGLNRTNQLYSFNPTNQQVVAGPVVNLYWGDVATLRLAQGKRVLSYSPHNKVAVTGNTSTYGNVYAWYYDRVDQPVATLKTGGVGFNSAQANNANANYIADPTSTLNAYQTNLTAVTSEGSTLYTLNSVTGTLTRYVTRLGQYNHVRQSETKLTSGIVNASSAIAVSPMDDGLYLLDAANRTVRYYADRRMGDVATTTSVATLGAKLGSTAGAYAKILSNNMRDFEALLDTSSNPPPFDDVASFGELQACITSCTNPSVNEAAQYFVNNKATVFTPMESISDPVPNDIFHVNDLNAYVTQQNTGGLSATQTTVTIPTQGVARSFTTPQATTPTGLAVSKATGLVYVLDSTLGTVTVGTTVTRTLNIHVYNPNGTFIETLALNVSDDQFVNDDDRLVPQSGQIMRLTLDEKKSQFYVHVENNGRTYQFGVDRQI
ncbi:MAG: hypothetical protein H2174_01685 [Vampirovibrio sp.]|nr:hypothetical protein [Vampirovibrio sp.]